MNQSIKKFVHEYFQDFSEFQTACYYGLGQVHKK